MAWLRKTALALGAAAAVAALSCPKGWGEMRPAMWRLAATDVVARDQALTALEAERARGAYGDVAPLAAALLADARRASDPRAAEGLAVLAAKAAPEDPRPSAFLAKFYLARSFRPGKALESVWRWLRAFTGDPWVQVAALWRLGAVAALAAWATVLALVAAGAVAFGDVLAHDYRDSFPRRFRRHTPAVLALLAVIALWTVGSGPAIFLLLVGLGLSPYLPRRGRWALGVSLALGCLLPQALGGLAVLGAPAGDRAWAFYRVWRGDAGPELAAELTRLFPTPDGRVLFVEARVARRDGDYAAAEEFLQQALTRPGVPASVVRTELGTLRFISGDGEGALEEFERASQADPSAALPWFGKHVVHLERLELGLADEALEKARALGAEGERRVQRRFAESSSQVAPPAPAMPAAWVRAELFGGSDAVGPPGWVPTLVRGVFLPATLVHPAAFGLLGIGVVLAGGAAGNGRRSRRCPSCGFVVCPRCGRRVKGSDLCPACWANGREEAADSAERERQARAAAQWEARRESWRRFGSAALPGWSAFLFRGGLSGLLLGVIWAGAAGSFTAGVIYPVALLPWGVPAFPWGGLAVMVGAHALGVWQAANRRKEE